LSILAISVDVCKLRVSSCRLPSSVNPNILFSTVPLSRSAISLMWRA
jgi:hypothetical protein